QHHALTLADVSNTLKRETGHKTLRRADVRHQFSNPFDGAVPVTETNIRRCDLGKDPLTSRIVRIRPRGEPSVHDAHRAGIELFRYDVGKERQLESPALNEVIPDGSLGEVMHET